MTVTQRLRRRRSWRNYQRRKRAHLLAQACQSRGTCPRRFGRYECGGRIETLVLRDGTTAIRCARCERLKAGLCLECPARVDGTIGLARRCAVHHDLQRRRQSAKWRRNHPLDAVRSSRRYCRAHRVERNASSRAWKRQHPEQCAATTRRWRARNAAKVQAIRAAYNARRRAAREGGQ